MKRSEINRALAWAEGLLARNHIRLPRYAYWDMDKWAENKEELETIRRTSLGWNVTDFGLNRFDEAGAVLYTARNGDRSDPSAGVPYRERYILMKEAQRFPRHFHASRTVDIINRAGGVLAVRLWNVDEAGQPLETEVQTQMDGIAHRFRPGEEILIYPGDSISLPPHTLHLFGPKQGYGDAILCEISPASDDSDSRFITPVQRFPEIEEDEPVLRPLCNEYNKLI